MRISDWSSDVCSSDLAELVDLLDGACFCASDDREADSWDTQHDRFLLDAQEMATRLLLGDEAALLERLRAVLAYRTQWFVPERSEEHTSELQSLMRISYAVFCLKKKNKLTQKYPNCTPKLSHKTIQCPHNEMQATTYIT